MLSRLHCRETHIASFQKWDASTDASTPPVLQNDYVVRIQPTCDASAVVGGLSSGGVKRCKLPDLALEKTLEAHGAGVADLAVHPTDAQLLASVSFDGHAFLWDARVPAPVLRIRAETALGAAPACCALGYEGALLACGGGPRIAFFDVRQTGGGDRPPVGILGDAIHTQDLCAVRFHPTQRHVLASAGLDGLVGVFDTRAAAGAENVLSILNADVAVLSFDFFGEGLEGLHLLTGAEGLQLWHFPSAQRFHEIGDLRHACRVAQEASNVAQPVAVDYAVDMLYRPEGDRLSLVVGSFGGAAAVFDVTPERLSPGPTLQGGHMDRLRGACWARPVGPEIITCGEDGRICAWLEGDAAPPAPASASAEKRSGQRRGRQYRAY